MFSITRLSSGTLRLASANHFLPSMQTCGIRMTQAIQPTSLDETFFEKNERLKRPMSPHLTIYKPQLTSMMSLTHRASGIVLTSYVVGLASFPFLPFNPHEAVNYINSLHLSPTTVIAAKAILALPIGYHVVNGFRHMMWDTGRGLTIKGVYTSGYICLALTIVTSIALAYL